jgi:AbrB family looped-hinge helix DNA binding protein
MTVYQIQVAKRGIITLPAEVRRENQIREGQTLSLIDWDGVLIIAPQELHTDRLANRLAKVWQEQGLDLETMLKTLREVRSEYAP